MKKLFILSIILFTKLIVGQIPNNSFENWSNSLPVDWYAINFTAPSQYHTESQTTAAHSGSLALRSDIISAFSSPCLSYPIKTGNTNNGFYSMGNNKPQYLFGWYQFQNFNSAFNVNIYFKNGNTQIGSGAFTTTTSQTSYKQFTININYTSILMPDSFSIVISMSDTFPSTNTCGSYYIIDDLSFDTNVGITESLLEKPQINFYPNPTNEMLNVEFKIFKENSSRIQLQNALGQILMDEKITCQHSSFNIQQLSSGMYFVKVIQGDKVLATKKLVKE